MTLLSSLELYRPFDWTITDFTINFRSVLLNFNRGKYFISLDVDNATGEYLVTVMRKDDDTIVSFDQKELTDILGPQASLHEEGNYWYWIRKKDLPTLFSKLRD